MSRRKENLTNKSEESSPIWAKKEEVNFQPRSHSPKTADIRYISYHERQTKEPLLSKRTKPSKLKRLFSCGGSKWRSHSDHLLRQEHRRHNETELRMQLEKQQREIDDMHRKFEDFKTCLNKLTGQVQLLVELQKDDRRSAERTESLNKQIESLRLDLNRITSASSLGMQPSTPANDATSSLQTTKPFTVYNSRENQVHGNLVQSTTFQRQRSDRVQQTHDFLSQSSAALNFNSNNHPTCSLNHLNSEHYSSLKKVGLHDRMTSANSNQSESPDKNHNLNQCTVSQIGDSTDHKFTSSSFSKCNFYCGAHPSSCPNCSYAFTKYEGNKGTTNYNTFPHTHRENNGDENTFPQTLPRAKQ